MVNSGEAIVIHCADTPNGDHSYDQYDVNSWHAKRGFKRQAIVSLRGVTNPWLPHIGYHSLILMDGTEVPGRDQKEMGAHCKGMNDKAWGVCMMGRTEFTLAQWDTLAFVIERWMALGAKSVFGHREIDRGIGNKKTCPGFDVQKWLAGGKKPLEGHIHA